LSFDIRLIIEIIHLEKLRKDYHLQKGTLGCFRVSIIVIYFKDDFCIGLLCHSLYFRV
jgi:hypothetical protein